MAMRAQGIRFLIRDAALWVAIQLAQRPEIDGFEVVTLSGNEETAELFASKVADALRLIAENDPLRYARIQRDLRRIVCLDIPQQPAAFHSDVRD